MKLKINEKEVECRSKTLAQLACEINLPERGVAVAVDRRIIPHAEWDGCVLQEGMEIFIITAVCGG